MSPASIDGKSRTAIGFISVFMWGKQTKFVYNPLPDTRKIASQFGQLAKAAP